MAFLTIPGPRQADATISRWLQPIARLAPQRCLRPFAGVCVRSALSEEGPRVKSWRVVAPPLLLPDGWMLISFLALFAHRVDGSCPGFSIP